MGSGFGNVNNPCVEVTRLPRQSLIDGVADQMSNSTPIWERREISQAGHLLTSEHIPQSELNAQATVFQHGRRSGHQRLRIDCPPIWKARLDTHGVWRLDEGSPVDWSEQAGPFQISSNNIRNGMCRLASTSVFCMEFTDGDGKRIHHALRDVDLEDGDRRRYLTKHRKRYQYGDRRFENSVSAHDQSAKHFSRIECQFDFSPTMIFSNRHLKWLAFQHSPNSALRCSAKERVCHEPVLIDNLRLPSQ